MPKFLTISQGAKFKAKKIEGGVNLTPPPPSRLLGLRKICCATFKNSSTYNDFIIEYLGREEAFYI